MFLLHFVFEPGLGNVVGIKGVGAGSVVVLVIAVRLYIGNNLADLLKDFRGDNTIEGIKKLFLV